MNLRAALRYATGGLLLILAVLSVPAITILVNRLLFIRQAQDSWAKSVLASELYWSFRMYEERGSTSMPESHTLFPYLDCQQNTIRPPYPNRGHAIGKIGRWSPELGDEIFEETLIIANIKENDNGYIRLIAEQLSAFKIAVLTSCIQASVLAKRCSEAVRAATYDKNDRLVAERNPTRSDALKAQSYCAYYPAVLAYAHSVKEGPHRDQSQ